MSGKCRGGLHCGNQHPEQTGEAFGARLRGEVEVDWVGGASGDGESRGGEGSGGGGIRGRAPWRNRERRVAGRALPRTQDQELVTVGPFEPSLRERSPARAAALGSRHIVVWFPGV